MKQMKQSVLFYFLFGQLIAGVNREKDKSNNQLTTDKATLSSHASRTLGVRTTDVKISHGRAKNYVENNITSSFSLTFEPLCFPYDTCSSRCGDRPRDIPYTCHCDFECKLFSDCCVDFEKECGDTVSHPIESNITIVNVTCELILNAYPLYTVSSCSQSWSNESFSKLCALRISSECFAASNSLSNLNNLNNAYERCVQFVYSQCEERIGSKCNETVEPLCVKLIKRECGRVSALQCRNCNETFWPVVDPNGILYGNSFCALCNFQSLYTVPDIQILMNGIHPLDYNAPNNTAERSKILKSRSCYPSVINFCPRGESNDLYTLCKSFSGYVINSATYKYTSNIYKNVYCALCHNESLNELKCAFSSANDAIEPNLMHVRPLAIDLVTGDIQGLRLDDIPATFSMLLNFGLDGRQRVYISSEGDEAMKRHQELCGKNRIWDPFSSVCRRLHCSAEFVLVDYQCVRKDSDDEETDQKDETVLVPDASADFVHLSFLAEMELVDLLPLYHQNIEEICDSIRESFSTSFNIKLDRIRNVSFNISLDDLDKPNAIERLLDEIVDINHPINFTISLDLYETSTSNSTEPEPSVDSIVSLLASSLAVNGFDFGINNVTSRIFQIQQSVDFLTSWCKSEDGGKKTEYWNSDFQLILENNTGASVGYRIRGIYVNKTDSFYPKGQFIVDILYQGYQFNQNLINVSGYAVVCDVKPRLNESCPRVILQKHEYEIVEGKYLVILNSTSIDKVVDDSVYEIVDNDSVALCILSPVYDDSELDYYMEMDIAQAYVSFILSWISVSAMIVVLFTYCRFSTLRNLPGCNTMNLTFSLLTMQITFLSGQRKAVTGIACKVVAGVLHYEILCCFTWMNVIAYDLYKTFGSKTILNNIRSKGEYLKWYMLYAYGTPSLIITTTSLLDYFLEHSEFSPHYGRNNVCWITSKHAAVAYFAVPLGLIMCINLSFFVLTICSISNVKHVLYLSHQKNKQRGKSDVLLYARMALVIGLTWALAFAAAYVKEERLTGQILTYLFIIFNTLQGVFIFCVFVCNRRVYDLYRESVRKLTGKTLNRSVSTKSSGGVFTVANAIHRTVSKDTVVSTVSNSSSCSNTSEISRVSEEV